MIRVSTMDGAKAMLRQDAESERARSTRNSDVVAVKRTLSFTRFTYAMPMVL